MRFHALIPAADDRIVVHDAVRPCIDSAALARLREALAEDPVGGLLAVPMASSLKRSDHERRVARSESRDGLWLALQRQSAELAPDPV